MKNSCYETVSMNKKLVSSFKKGQLVIFLKSFEKDTVMVIVHKILIG